jgi:flagellar assembly protein FliH
MPSGRNEIVPFDMPVLEKEVGKEERVEILPFQNPEKIEKEAFERGYETGEKAGFAMGEQKAIALLDRLEGFLREISTLKKSLLNETEPQIIELAVGIARKIILKELTLNPEEIVRITREAMMRIERTGTVTIKINPLLHDLFMKYKPDIQSAHQDIIFDVDPSAPRYGSVVAGPVADAVADVDEQLRNLIKEMVDRLACD